MAVACEEATTLDSRPVGRELFRAQPGPRLNKQYLANLLELVKPPLLVFFTSRLLCFLVGYLTMIVFYQEKPNVWRMAPDNLAIDWTARWDSGWYNTIVYNGYVYSPGGQCNVCFFPLYPLLIRSLCILGTRPIIIALIVDHLAFLGGLIYLYALGRRVLPDRESAERTLWLLAFFPTALFYSAYYTESVFLFLSTATFYHGLRRQWVRAVLFAALASACRVPGVFLYGFLMMELLKNAGWSLATIFRAESWRNLIQAVRQQWATLLLIQASVLGLVGFMIFLYVRFGDPFLFSKMQIHWQRQNKGPIYYILDGLHTFCLNLYNGEVKIISTCDLFCLLAGLALGVVAWRRLGESYGVYCLASLLLPASTQLQSFSRYFCVVFPVFMALSLKLRNPGLERATLLTFSALLACFTAMFATWQWVG